jgi:hypothetical protein
MLDAKPTIFISHSTVFKEQVALPFCEHIKSLGMNAILVGDMPVPADADSDPETKVDYFLQGADMFVALLTPDDHLQDGEIRSRPNIADEIGRAKSLPLLRRRIQVFRAAGVKVHSNINPTYEPLDISDPAASFPTFERQAMEWGVMPRPGSESLSEPAVGPIGPAEAERSEGHEGDGATIQAASALAQLRSTLLGLKGTPDLPRALAIRRAHIAASTALTSLTSSSVYGVHELNGLYRTRAELQLSPEEVRHLFRSVVLHLDSDTAPGWYWLRGTTATEVHEMLIELAAADPDTELRAIALNLLARAPRKLARSQVNSLVDAGLKSEEGQIRNATLRLLGAKGDLRLLREIKAKLGRDSAEAQLEIRARETPVAALKALVADPFSHSENAERILLANPKKLPTSTLREGLASTSYIRTRLLCLRGLERSARLRRKDLDHLLSDKIAKLRDQALEIAFRRRWKVDEALAEEAIQTSDLDFHASGERVAACLSTDPEPRATRRPPQVDRR